MAPKAKNFVSDIKPWKTEWRVHVKAVHSWKQPSKFGGESLEMILADENGAKIQASCKIGFVSKVERELPINQWRLIDTFSVSPARGHYRTTAHAYKIAINNDTSITPSDVKTENLFLSLKSFKDINNGILDSDFLIDVFGQVVDVGDIQTVQVNGEQRKKCEFYLRDTSDQRIQCCLWGRFAEQIQECCQEADKQITLCLIRFAKITSYRGDVQVTNSFDASDVEINPSIPESDEYIKMLSQDDMSVTSNGLGAAKNKFRKKREVWLTYPVKTIAEILHATEIEKCRVTATISGNDTDWAWFYFGCGQCTKKVLKIRREIALANSTKPLWCCDTCHMNVSKVEPKFKLHLMVKDDNNNTKMMLLDSEAQKVVGFKAEKLWDGSYDEMEDPSLLPEEVKGAVGKTFHFGVQINKENVSYGADTFKISKVWTLEELAKMEAEAAEADAYEAEEQESDDQLITMSSTKSSEKLSTQSEISSKDMSYDLSTPLSKRKDEIDVLPDLNSTTKKQCTKLIKLEKGVSK